MGPPEPPVGRASGLSIGLISGRSGCHIETIRYYERIGVLAEPPRTAAGQRVYGETHLARLRFIRRARELGFSLDQIRQLLAMVDGGITTCGEVKSIALDHLADVRRKLADLRRMERALRETANRCHGGEVPHCPVIDMLANPSSGNPESTGRHRKRGKPVEPVEQSGTQRGY